MDALDDLRLEIEVRDADRPFPTALTVYAVVNGERMPACLDACQFLAAVADSGRHPLFTCGCGTFDCGGYWVDVECATDAWVWRDGFFPHDNPAYQGRIHSFHHRFAWAEVADALEHVRDGLLAVRARSPDAWPLTGPCGRAYFARRWPPLPPTGRDDTGG